MILPHNGETVRVTGENRNGIPRAFYTYRGDGHDAVEPETCNCGNCGRRTGAVASAKTRAEKAENPHRLGL